MLAAASRRSLEVAGKPPKARCHIVGQDAANAFALAHAVACQSRQGTSLSAIGAMAIREIGAGESGEVLIPAQAPRSTRQRTGDRFRCQIVLGREMTVEAAVCEAGLLHHRVYADAVKAVLAEQARGRLHDAIPILRCLLPAHAHVTLRFSAFA